MRFILTINMDNAAFEDAADDELGRILREIASQTNSGTTNFSPRRVRDINGNTVGEWSITE